MVNQLNSVIQNLLQWLHNSPAFLALGVTVQNTIKSTEFCLSVISGLKFKILSQ